MSLYEVGLAVDQAARRYMKANPGVDYQNACNAVIKKAHAESAERKERALKAYRSEHGDDPAGLGWRIYEDTDGNVVDAEMIGTGRNINRLSDTVLGLPRLADHSVNGPLAVRIINTNFRDIAQGAAGDFLSASALTLVSDRNASPANVATHNRQDGLFRDCLEIARREHPEIASIYDGGRMTEAGLRQLLWPIF